MELISITVTGYGRFRSRTSLQTNGKLIAILGPNEAGKSSLLRAITHLGHGRGLAADEISRDFEPEDVRIVGRFHLDADETVAARLSGPRSLTVTKHADGRRLFGFDPPAPDRDVSHREPLAHMLRKLAKEDFVAEGEVDDELSTDLEELADALASARSLFSRTLCGTAKISPQVGNLRHSLAMSSRQPLTKCEVIVARRTAVRARPGGRDGGEDAKEGMDASITPLDLFDRAASCAPRRLRPAKGSSPRHRGHADLSREQHLASHRPDRVDLVWHEQPLRRPATCRFAKPKSIGSRSVGMDAIGFVSSVPIPRLSSRRVGQRSACSDASGPKKGRHGAGRSLGEDA